MLVEVVVREQVAIRPVGEYRLHELTWSDDEKPIRVLAVDDSVSDFLCISDVNVVADLGFKYLELRTRDVHPPGVA